MTDHCSICDCPIGLGSCDGCIAAAVSGDMDSDSYAPQDCCEYCGKPYECFDDLGCAYCDARSPEWGVMP